MSKICRCFSIVNTRCFDMGTPEWLFKKSKHEENNGKIGPYFPPYFGAFDSSYISPMHERQLVYNLTTPLKNLVTLTFTADSVSFVSNKSVIHDNLFTTIDVHASIKAAFIFP